MLIFLWVISIWYLFGKPSKVPFSENPFLSHFTAVCKIRALESNLSNLVSTGHGDFFIIGQPRRNGGAHKLLIFYHQKTEPKRTEIEINKHQQQNTGFFFLIIWNMSHDKSDISTQIFFHLRSYIIDQVVFTYLKQWNILTGKDFLNFCILFSC